MNALKSLTVKKVAVRSVVVILPLKNVEQASDASRSFGSVVFYQISILCDPVLPWKKFNRFQTI